MAEVVKKVLIENTLLPGMAAAREGSVLRRPDFRIFTTSSAEEALEMHRAEKMDLIVVTLDMPEMGGDRLCSLIRQDEVPGKVFVILVCSGKRPELMRCELCGASSYATGPEAAMEKAARALGVPERKGLRVLVKVTVEGRFKTEPFYCTSRDVSISGILLETEKILARGDIITCSFYLPDADRIDARAEVVRIVRAEDSYQYGVQFLELVSESMRTIEVFVGRKLKGEV